MKNLGVFSSGGLLNGRRKSILEVGSAIRTGVRLGSITKETALNSKSNNIFCVIWAFLNALLF